MFGVLIEKSTLQVLISPTWGRVRTNATRCEVSLVWIVIFSAILGWLLGIVTSAVFRWRTRARRHR
jgi:hypothetical protein